LHSNSPVRNLNNACREARFTKNWFKLRFFGWTEFDALIILDSDCTVRGDLTHIFKLPTDFAWALEAGEAQLLSCLLQKRTNDL